MKKDCEPILYKEFAKMDIRVGTIKAVKDHPDADKLYLILVDFGKEDIDRQIVAGIKQWYTKKDLIGKKIVVLTNLEPKVLRGIESNGMLLAAEKDGKVVLLTVEKDIPNGAKIS
jgi:methionyl-tRNA synthetase